MSCAEAVGAHGSAQAEPGLRLLVLRFWSPHDRRELKDGRQEPLRVLCAPFLFLFRAGDGGYAVKS